MMRWKSLFVLSLGLLVAGCQATTSGGGGKGLVKTELAPTVDQYNIKRVAILAMANTTGEAAADEMADFATRALLSTGRYEFAVMDAFQVDAVREGVESEYKRTLSRWNNTLEVEPLVLGKLLGATKYDAVLAMEVRNWSEFKIDASQEGTSDTTVGLYMSLFAADGTLLWTGSRLKTERSIPYDPSFNQKMTERGTTRTTSASAVPEPPDVRKVAMDVANEVAEALPKIGPRATPAS